jgi:hypothetical protein
MDSMRSLNTSLPRSTSQRQRRRTPTPQILQGFKSAALSLTNFYKSAVSEQKDFRQAGYQDALDDLLAFLDHENLGLDDGEGWKIRQWATERLEGDGASGQSVGDSDEEQADPETRARSSSPISNHQQTQTNANQQDAIPSSPQQIHQTVNQSTKSGSSSTVVPTSGEFSFRSTAVYPRQEHEMEVLENDVNSQSQMRIHTPSGNNTSSSVKFEVVPRTSRLSAKHNNYTTSRMSTRSLSSLGSGAGSKRKLALGEFFDIQGFGGGKDAFGGSGTGKRGRHS